MSVLGGLPYLSLKKSTAPSRFFACALKKKSEQSIIGRPTPPSTGGGPRECRARVPGCRAEEDCQREEKLALFGGIGDR
jgi:hypothetical protein